MWTEEVCEVDGAVRVDYVDEGGPGEEGETGGEVFARTEVDEDEIANLWD